MAAKALPSPEALRQLVRYEPDTGLLFWLHRPQEFFAREKEWRRWNSRYAGKEAFTSTNGRGYKISCILGQYMSAHKLAWALHYGEWPSSFIDHANRDRTDNRIQNLRLCTPSQNAANKTRKEGGSSVYTGVSFYKPSGKWMAGIGRGNKTKYLGLFDTELEAAMAYDKAALEDYGDFANLNFSGGASVLAR